jgi:hypothetical protein
MRKRRVVFGRTELVTLLLGVAAVAAVGIRISAGSPLVLKSITVADNFENGYSAAWEFPFPEDWTILGERSNHFLHMLRSRPPGVPRRPIQFARLKGVNVGGFALRARVRREGRSMIVVFNYVDTLHFYYTHLSMDRGTGQPAHNGIFIVNGEPRKRIAGTEAVPALPDREWHRVRVVRNLGAGSIQVYVDEGRQPLFSTVDRTFTCGQVGFGSFDETGDFDSIVLESNDAGCVPGSPLRPASANQARGASN